jgi:DNA uptake protein ComE-like DNA-binding protein
MNSFDEHSYRLHKKHRTGILILLGILLLLIMVWRMLPLFFSPPVENSRQALAWEKFKSNRLLEEPPIRRRNFALINDSGFSERYKLSTSPNGLFFFNPNTASEADLLDLGLPERAVRTLLHYREKGGVFKKKEDLKKIYNLTSNDYSRIEPYIQIPSVLELSGTPYPKQHNAFREKHAYRSTYQVINLNEADTTALMALPGIGPVYSKRIIAFRTALGGFAAVSQLKEVYGFPDSTYNQLKDRFFVSSGGIKKININTASRGELYRQPYLRPIVKELLRLRERLGRFEDIADLRQIPLINDEKYRKIAPYLSVH